MQLHNKKRKATTLFYKATKVVWRYTTKNEKPRHFFRKPQGLCGDAWTTFVNVWLSKRQARQNIGFYFDLSGKVLYLAKI